LSAQGRSAHVKVRQGERLKSALCLNPPAFNMTKASATAPEASQPPLPATYELALAELEQLVSRLDAGQLPLDQLLAQYQRGTQLLGFCRGLLQNVEAQIKVLDNGELKPWEAN
jgi:exodeoxyribonuclease VII small subunit